MRPSPCKKEEQPRSPFPVYTYDLEMSHETLSQQHLSCNDKVIPSLIFAAKKKEVVTVEHNTVMCLLRATTLTWLETSLIHR